MPKQRYLAVWLKPRASEDDEPLYGRKVFATAQMAADHVKAVSADAGCGFVELQEWMLDPMWDEEFDDHPQPMSWETIQSARCENGEVWEFEVVDY